MPPRYLLDTHVWFRMASGSRRLSREHRRLIERAPDRCAISAATIWEIGLLADRGRIKLNALPREWCQRNRREWPVAVLSMDAETAIRATEISLGTGDPVDHVIAATALVNELTLLTEDGPMLDAPWLDTV